MSAIAYERPYSDGVRGDVWDMVLADCGYDVGRFRTEEWSWEPSFRIAYTTDVFRDLWRGQEHLCPYYDEAINYEGSSESEDSSVEWVTVIYS